MVQVFSSIAVCSLHGCYESNLHIVVFLLGGFVVLFGLYYDPRWRAIARVRSHFGSSRDPSTRLEFPLPLPSRQPHQDSFRVRFLFAVYIAWHLLLVFIKCGKSGCTGSCPLSVVEYGYKAGRKQATCRTCGKTFPRPNVTLADFFPAKSDKISCHVSTQPKHLTCHISNVKCCFME